MEFLSADFIIKIRYSLDNPPQAERRVYRFPPSAEFSLNNNPE